MVKEEFSNPNERALSEIQTMINSFKYEKDGKIEDQIAKLKTAIESKEIPELFLGTEALQDTYGKLLLQIAERTSRSGREEALTTLASIPGFDVVYVREHGVATKEFADVLSANRWHEMLGDAKNRQLLETMLAFYGPDMPDAIKKPFYEMYTEQLLSAYITKNSTAEVVVGEDIEMFSDVVDSLYRVDKEEVKKTLSSMIVEERTFFLDTAKELLETLGRE